jgi:hypothetical protein
MYLHLCPARQACDIVSSFLSGSPSLRQCLFIFVRLLRLGQFICPVLSGSYTCGNLFGSYACDNLSLQSCSALTLATIYLSSLVWFLHPRQFVRLLRLRQLPFQFCPVLTPAAICPALTPAAIYLSIYVRLTSLRPFHLCSTPPRRHLFIFKLLPMDKIWGFLIFNYLLSSTCETNVTHLS